MGFAITRYTTAGQTITTCSSSAALAPGAASAKLAIVRVWVELEAQKQLQGVGRRQAGGWDDDRAEAKGDSMAGAGTDCHGVNCRVDGRALMPWFGLWWEGSPPAVARQ